MADLESCYFCGAADDVQEYAVIPPRFSPSREEQQTVVLCEDCYDKLGRIVSPIADRLDEAIEAEAPREPQSAAKEGEEPEEPVTDAVAPEGEGITIEPSSGESHGEKQAESDEVARETAAADAPTAAAGPGTERPAGYRKVMRLLENREFPMDRTEVEAMAASAYEIEEERIHEIVDAAIDADEFVEEEGQLKRL